MRTLRKAAAARGRVLVAAVAVVAYGLVAGPAAPANAIPDRPPVPALEWADCGDGFECATATVPLDYDDPGGHTIELALTRLPASDPARRIGTAFVGGPGSYPGTNLLRDIGAAGFDPRVHERFDLVGFDRRGVGASAPVRCFATQAGANAFYDRYPAYPTSRRERAAVDRLNREYADRCTERNGTLLAHVSSADVARDLDLLRAAVGDDRLTYIGYSHSAYVGAIYANLFPDRVRALTLVSPQYAPEFTVGSPATAPFGRSNADLAAEVALEEFFRQCAAAGERCAFGGDDADAAELAASYDRLRRRLARAPIESPISWYTKPIGEDDLAWLAANLLFSTGNYAVLADSLRAVADEVDGSGSDRGAVDAAGTVPPPVADEPYPNTFDGWATVLCADVDSPDSVRGHHRAQLRRTRVAPRFGAYYAWYEPKCEDWPGPARDRYTGPWPTSTSAPILVVANRHDPIGWLPGAASMTEVLDGSVLLAIDGWGHLPIGTSSCADAAMADYLIDGILPAEGTACPADTPPFS